MNLSVKPSLTIISLFIMFLGLGCAKTASQKTAEESEKAAKPIADSAKELKTLLSKDLNKKVKDLPQTQTETVVEKVVVAIKPFAKAICLVENLTEEDCEAQVSECLNEVDEHLPSEKVMHDEIAKQLKKFEGNTQEIVDCLTTIAEVLKEASSKVSCSTSEEELNKLQGQLENKFPGAQERIKKCVENFGIRMEDSGKEHENFVMPENFEN